MWNVQQVTLPWRQSCCNLVVLILSNYHSARELVHLRMAFEVDMRSRRESLETDGYNYCCNNFHIEGEELCDVDDDKVLIEAGNKFDFEWVLPCNRVDFQA